MSGVDRLLAEAREKLTRVDAARADQILRDGGLLIDIRPAAQRVESGEVPGAIVVERNNLEWRLDPQGADRIPEAADPDRVVVIMCQEGYASSLAAASLVSLGRPHATDLEGGFVAWKVAGLPTRPSGGPSTQRG